MEPLHQLLEQPWLPAHISAHRLLAKSWFGEAEYQILLTDLRCVWQESVDAEAVQRRAQELNRRLRAPVGAFFSHLRQVARPCLAGSDGAADGGGDAQVSLVHQQGGAGGVTIKLKSELAGLPFYWDFHCSPAPVTTVCTHLVRPLLAVSHLLQQQTEQLGDLLERKDAEILDYKENGATLSRERLQTDVFDEHAYREEFVAKEVPRLCRQRSDPLGFHAGLQRLYGAVVAAQSGEQTRKRKVSERENKEEEEEEEEEREREGKGEESAAATTTTTTSPGEPAGGQAAAGGGERRRRQVDVGGATAEAGGLEVRQRPVPKPKKKKAVGLFR